jgi:hypothetical protein
MNAHRWLPTVGLHHTVETDLRDRSHLDFGGPAILKAKRDPSSTAC